MPKIRELEQYPPIHEIFRQVCEEQDTVFLDSSLKNHLGKWSVIGLHPYLRLRKGEKFTINEEIVEADFSSYTKQYLREHKQENDTKLPLISGAIGYFSYDYGREKEEVDTIHKKELDIPECILNFYDDFIIEDHIEKKLYLVANGNLCIEEKAIKELENILNKAQTLIPRCKKQFSFLMETDFSKAEYKQTIRKMIDYIIEGDIYITNMTQQMRICSKMQPYEFFNYLRHSNPSPFGGYFNYGDFQIVSASPERFLQMHKGYVETRPIKGTRRRGADEEEDEMLRQELMNSEKDKSELLMIVDLERNDLNRVCKPGSVKVTELFEVETYATVFHLVSNVVGTLREKMTAMDLIDAAFPGGSITGAPKLRAMEIIDELERSRRNLYTGSMGYMSLNGDCDMNIVIRTAVYKDGTYHIGAGGGITCESDLEFEYEEVMQKAKALVEILQNA